MKRKVILFVAIICLINYVKAQSNPDVRKVVWDMTSQEVLVSEYPLIPEVKNDDLVFANVDIGNRLFANITYSFKKGKLSRIAFEVFGPRFINGKEAGFIDVVNFSRPFLNAYKNNGYICFLGW